MRRDQINMWTADSGRFTAFSAPFQPGPAHHTHGRRHTDPRRQTVFLDESGQPTDWFSSEQEYEPLSHMYGNNFRTWTLFSLDVVSELCPYTIRTCAVWGRVPLPMPSDSAYWALMGWRAARCDGLPLFGALLGPSRTMSRATR